MKKRWKWLLAIIVVAVLIGAFVGFKLYNRFQKPIVNLEKGESYYLYIPTESTYEDVLDLFEQEELLLDTEFFKLLAERKNYPRKVKAGRYKLHSKMTANALVNKLRSGAQDPVNVTFNNLRFAEELVPIVCKKLEADSILLMHAITDEALMQEYGFDKQNFVSMFLPDTYEFFWNTSEKGFLDRMKKQYDQFWTDERRKKAEEIGLTPQEVSVLASIVQSETIKRDEMAKVAGLYINRLNKGMLLQADPTVKFAIGDFSITRVLYKHLEYDSPYNTYIYPGLPPGPICMAYKHTIDYVLNYERHNYIFMCAKADGSGYHAFARNSREHTRNANAYHRYIKEWQRKNRKKR